MTPEQRRLLERTANATERMAKALEELIELNRELVANVEHLTHEHVPGLLTNEQKLERIRTMGDER